MKLLFSVLTKRKTVCEVNAYNFFHETDNSRHPIISLTSFSCFIALENTFVDQSKRTYSTNYFIIQYVATLKHFVK